MKKQICSSLLALTMTMGTVAPAMAAEVEVNVQSAECTCTTACTEDSRNADCAICGAEGAQLTDCAQAVPAQDDANDEQQDTNAENGFEYTVTGDEATITGYTGSAKNIVIPSELGSKKVTAIADKAFEGYGKMRDIYIPKTIKAIGENAFFDADSTDIVDRYLRVICYEGTETEWKNIDIQEGNYALNPSDDVSSERKIRVYECSLSSDMVYQASNDAATLIRYFGSDSKVEIPAELGGKPVSVIGELAFGYYSNLKEVTIPEGVKSIGMGAFAYCTSLTEVTIPKSVTSIGKLAFYSCTALETGTVYYGGLQEDWDALKNNIGSDNDPLLSANIIYSENPNDYAYTANTSGDGVTITKYNGEAKKVIIPSELDGKKVTSIGNDAFSDNTTITSIEIPEGVTSIGDWAFYGCSSLVGITIPDSVTTIQKGSFAFCTALTSIKIPKNVSRIETGTFLYCTALESITLPKGLTFIDFNAFQYCDALKTVYYGGLQEDWDNITINNEDEGNDPLLKANLICKEKPKICKGGKEVEISNGAHEMRIHGKSYGTFTFAWVDSKAGWSIQNADGKYLSFDNGKLVLSDTAYVWKYDAKFYTTTEEKTTSSGWGWGWWGRPSTTTKTTYWYLVGDGTDLSISKSETNADVKLYDATESTEHSFGKWTPAEERKHTRTCTICGETETGDCTYENGACTVCGALDPDNASVSVSATVTKRTSGGGGWWWWNRPTTTTWEARITATGTGVDIDKVEYSNDGKHYLTGTSFTSDTEITKFYIRVTDSKGNVTNWLYENGKVTQK